MNFNDRLKQAMNLRNVSQIELVEKSGIDKSTISGYVNGKFNPKFDRIQLFAKILNVNIDWLLGQSEEMEIKTNPFIKKDFTFTDENRKVLRTRLLDTMIAKGFKQEELAEFSNTPIEIINGYIIGNVEPDFEYIERLAKTLDVVPDFLIGEDRRADLQILARKMNKLDQEKFERALALVDSIIDSLEKTDGLGK